MFSSIALLTSMLALGIALFAEKRRQAKQRRGLITVKRTWEISYNRTRTAIMTVVVQELDRVADQSRVKILHIDDAPGPQSIKYAKKEIGKWYPTKDVKWGSPPKTAEPPKQQETQPKQVSNKQLLEAVLADRPETL